MRPNVLFPLFADVTTLDGVGPRVREALNRAFGGSRIKDLLFTPPSGLIDRSYRPHISGAKKGEICTFAVTVGRHSPPSARGRPYRIRVFDETGDMMLIFFHANQDYLERILPEGSRRLISGRADVYNTRLQITHPDYVLPPNQSDELPKYETQYALTAGLSQKVAHKTVMQALDRVPDMPEWLDPAMVTQQDWPKFGDAIRFVHQPDHPVDTKVDSPARQRLAYDEFLAKQLAMVLVRASTGKRRGRAMTADGTCVEDVLKAATFKPTGAQERAFNEILADLKSPCRMSRLVQGDVGAGKTFVAALACAYVAECGFQVAFMAPTEILARQHADTLKTFLDPAGLTVESLTGRDTGRAREALISGLAAGHIDVIAGTHALFQDKVQFADLGLAIIDEQHRFGVQDRLRLTHKGQSPDLLVMTATPIPRTLALTSYGDMDISKIGEKPAGRQPIKTRILPMTRLDNVVEAVGRAVKNGSQVYWVCPLVEDSEVIDLTSVEDRHRHLTAVFGDRVGLLHGRLSAREKTAVSEAFKVGQFDILIATTVIEVGVDAPNATIIIIEHAERFGLAQLHQLRGRVGRSHRASSCLLLYQGALSQNGRVRLEIMRESNDGFLIAEKDWELRGSGDLLGSRQSGLPKFSFADMDWHKSLLETAHRDARLLVEKDPQLKSARGKAARVLLYLFEQDYGVGLMQAG
ncbi:MAG: ATP-dependent DNA helicase RecG [Hyphomonadaceae bacterium]|nr:ATP-dependent DNA helicase RecG [Hyphomonadaceae bacterium]